MPKAIGCWCAVWFLFSGCLTGYAASQDYMVKTWGVDEGLPESSITDVVQSKDGYLWVSTLNSGLARFDGIRFVSINLPPAALHFSGGIRRLCVGGQGTLWLNGFGEYLARLQAGEFYMERTDPTGIDSVLQEDRNHIVFGAREGMLERRSGGGTNFVYRVIHLPGTGTYPRLFPDATGAIWYRRTDRQLARMTDGKSTIMPLPPGGGGHGAVLAGDRWKTIAAANADGLFVWRDEKFEDVTPTNGEAWTAVSGLILDGLGGWWLEADGRLRHCRDRQWVAEAAAWSRQNRSWQNVRFPQADAEGGLWFAYADTGIFHISAAGKLSTITTAEGLPNNRVRTLTQDREGNIWASFERGGLSRIRPRRFQAVEVRDGLKDIVTSSVCEDARGAIWIGTADGLVSRWEHGVCSNFALPLAPGEGCQVATVCADSTGRVWVGTRGAGLWVGEHDHFDRVLQAAPVGDNIRGVFVSRDDRLWIASLKGLFSFQDGRLQLIIEPKFPEDYPTALAEGANGTIWVTMQSAKLVKLASGQVTVYQPADVRMQSLFSAVHEDEEGTVWVGTLGGGLLRFRNGQFTAFTKRDGLPTDIIFQVLDDDRGGLWLGSPAGVINVRKSTLDAPGVKSVFRVFGRNDGLPSIGCASSSQPTAWRGHDGRLWFATARGVASVQPEDSEHKAIAPLVALEDLLVDGKVERTFVGRLDDGSNAPIQLTPGLHHLEFQYTGFSFAAPEGIHFKYILEGLDKEWIENQINRVAQYNSVPPGKYRFRVQSCSSDGLWSGESTVELVLPPHFWQARWFSLLVPAASLLLVAGVVFWWATLRQRRQVRALEQQQVIERERARIAKDLHDDLGTTLTQIDLLGALASRPGMSPGETLEQVGLIQSKSREMVTALDEIVWAVNPRNDSLNALTTYFCNFAEDFLPQSGIQCRVDMADEMPDFLLTSEVRHGLFLAFKEALNNVVRHAGAKEVWLRFSVSGSVATLVVQDDGGGFIPEKMSGGEGNGLRNMRERMAQIGGTCEVRSELKAGTTITFTLRLK